MVSRDYWFGRRPNGAPEELREYREDVRRDMQRLKRLLGILIMNSKEYADRVDAVGVKVDAATAAVNDLRGSGPTPTEVDAGLVRIETAVAALDAALHPAPAPEPVVVA